jgi:methionyl-tRNA formyltransferase
MRAIFMGTPEIAVPALEALSHDFEVAGVVCQPDRPAGRGLQPNPPAVKRRAIELGFEVIQPLKVRTPDFLGWVRDRRPEFVLVMAYGRIVPPDVLATPPFGCLNLHASILPRYRGAAPIQWAVIRGEHETGISLMQMEAGLDTGPVYAVRKVTIDENETAGELAARLASLAAEVVRADLPKVLDRTLASVPQLESEATLAPMLTKDDGLIDWTRPAEQVHDHVRGMHPWPGAFTRLGGRTLKVLATRRSTLVAVDVTPGTVLTADSSGVLVACGQGVVEIARGKMEGRKPLSGPELANGRTLQRGMKLG